MKQGLRIKFSRQGRKHSASYRISVMPQYKNPSRNVSIEDIGFWNPYTKQITIDQERMEYYLKNGATLTPSVASKLSKYAQIKV